MIRGNLLFYLITYINQGHPTLPVSIILISTIGLTNSIRQRVITFMFPVPYVLLGVALLLPLSFLSAKTYIWTDTNGQQIEAEFVRSTADTLTISMQGQELDLLKFTQCVLQSTGDQIKIRVCSGKTGQPAPMERFTGQSDSGPVFRGNRFHGKIALEWTNL